ncbi:MAG: alpha-N-arabinofuranosidase, partial [Muribaculaceae bacterium]|nr:alpha-N-arabinofuranosidase [Muribaculaceae bacterium]
NIAQVANVLQSTVLTKGDQMVLTPTYYVFKMYVPHQGARVIPAHIDCATVKAESERSSRPRTVPMASATASEKDGIVTISLTNVDLDRECDMQVALGSLDLKKIVKAEILTAADIHDYNDFGQPEKVTIKNFNGATIKGSNLNVKMPVHSIVTLQLTK